MDWAARHRAFVAYCAGANLDWHSDEAEYGFLKHELETNYAYVLAKLRPTKTLADATQIFERYYEGAGVVAMGHRLAGANLALDAWHAHQGDVPVAGSTVATSEIQPQGSG